MPPTAHSRARAILERIQSAFDAAVERAALLCARDGKLDSGRLDAHQWISYELALTSADLLAAKTLVEGATKASGIDSGLALAFATEAIGSMLGRLDGLYLECGLDTRALHEIAGDAQLAQLRAQAGGGAALAALGKAVAESDAEIAEVELDETATIARDSFRAFARDVVAPI